MSLTWKLDTQNDSRKLRILSLFSGIGGYELAIERLGYTPEIAAWAEIDPIACKVYEALHSPAGPNLGALENADDDTIRDIGSIDILSYSFPCQDLSRMGKHKGMREEDGSLTRSGLLLETIRYFKLTSPKYAICENAPKLLDTEEYQYFLQEIGKMGYNTVPVFLKPNEIGIPARRQRVYLVSSRIDGAISGILEIPHKNQAFIPASEFLLPAENVPENFWLEDQSDAERFYARRLQPCITASGYSIAYGGHSWRIAGQKTDKGIYARKLTVQEIGRFMGFLPAECDIITETVKYSDRKFTHLIGNSICIPVVSEILLHLLPDAEDWKDKYDWT